MLGTLTISHCLPPSPLLPPLEEAAWQLSLAISRNFIHNSVQSCLGCPCACARVHTHTHTPSQLLPIVSELRTDSLTYFSSGTVCSLSSFQMVSISLPPSISSLLHTQLTPCCPRSFHYILVQGHHSPHPLLLYVYSTHTSSLVNAQFLKGEIRLEQIFLFSVPKHNVPLIHSSFHSYSSIFIRQVS